MHLAISLLLLSSLGLILWVVRRAAQVDRTAPTDPQWYDVKLFHDAAAILDDEDMRALLDTCTEEEELDSGMELRAWTMAALLKDAPNSLHNPVARKTSTELAHALESLLERLENHAGREALEKAIARTDAAYLAYRSYFYDLTGE